MQTVTLPIVERLNTNQNPFVDEFQAEHERRDTQRRRNIAHQEEVHVRIVDCTKMLQKGNIPGALNELQQAYNLASQISDFSDIVSQIATPPSIFTTDLITLNKMYISYKDRACNISEKLATEVIDQALNLFCILNVDAVLYAEHRLTLNAAIIQAFNDAWYKFDERPIPSSFTNNIARIIHSRLKPIGWKKWVLDRDKNVSIHEIDKCLEAINKSFEDYEPASAPKIINLFVGSSTAVLTFISNNSPFTKKQDLIHGDITSDTELKPALKATTAAKVSFKNT